MSSTVVKTHRLRKRRAIRVRKPLRGTAERPRLCVNKSNRHLAVQIIDDEAGKTLVSASTFSKVARESKDGAMAKKSKASAKVLGEHVAKLAAEKKINKVVFDRGSHKYHGVLVEFAEGARSAGLTF